MQFSNFFFFQPRLYKGVDCLRNYYAPPVFERRRKGESESFVWYARVHFVFLLNINTLLSTYLALPLYFCISKLLSGYIDDAFYEIYCLLCEYKRYFKIDQHLALHFVYYGCCLSNPPPYYAVK